jgi:hypothetical protein
MGIVGKALEDVNVFYDCQQKLSIWVFLFHTLLFFFYLLLQVFQIYTNISC